MSSSSSLVPPPAPLIRLNPASVPVQNQALQELMRKASENQKFVNAFAAEQPLPPYFYKHWEEIMEVLLLDMRGKPLGVPREIRADYSAVVDKFIAIRNTSTDRNDLIDMVNGLVRTQRGLQEVHSYFMLKNILPEHRADWTDSANYQPLPDTARIRTEIPAVGLYWAREFPLKCKEVYYDHGVVKVAKSHVDELRKNPASGTFPTVFIAFMTKLMEDVRTSGKKIHYIPTEQAWRCVKWNVSEDIQPALGCPYYDLKATSFMSPTMDVLGIIDVPFLAMPSDTEILLVSVKIPGHILLVVIDVKNWCGYFYDSFAPARLFNVRIQLDRVLRHKFNMPYSIRWDYANFNRNIFYSSLGPANNCGRLACHAARMVVETGNADVHNNIDLAGMRRTYNLIIKYARNARICKGDK